jgi:hypothetical protein
MTVSLAELKILSLDCQATGANPQKGHLLELGWMSTCASPTNKSHASGVQAYLNRLPVDEKIPRRGLSGHCRLFQPQHARAQTQRRSCCRNNIYLEKDDRSFHRRQKHLSLITYDRLRILTTELRRLISENRPIELCLGPTVTLGNDNLKKALRWV